MREETSYSVLKCQYLLTKFCLQQGAFSRQAIARQPRGLAKFRVWTIPKSKIYDQALER